MVAVAVAVALEVEAVNVLEDLGQRDHLDHPDLLDSLVNPADKRLQDPQVLPDPPDHLDLKETQAGLDKLDLPDSPEILPKTANIAHVLQKVVVE